MHPKYQLLCSKIIDLIFCFVIYYCSFYFDDWTGTVNGILLLLSFFVSMYNLTYFLPLSMDLLRRKSLKDSLEENQEEVGFKIKVYILVTIFLLASWINYQRNSFRKSSNEWAIEKVKFQDTIRKQSDSICDLKINLSEVKSSLNDEYRLSQKYNEFQLEELYNSQYSGAFTLRDIYGNKTLTGTMQNGEERGIWTYYDNGEVINKYEYVKVRSGATCNDGSTSYATGRGACSWHGGVAYWNYSYQRRKLK